MPAPRTAPRRPYHGYETVRDSAFSQWLGTSLHADFDATLDGQVPPALLRLIQEQAKRRS